MASQGKWVVQVTSGAVRYADASEHAADSSFEASLNALRERRKAMGVAGPLGMVTVAAVLAALVAKLPLWVAALLLILGGAATWFARARDFERRMAVVQYELDRNVTDAWARVVKAAKSLDACSGKWRLVPATIGGGLDRSGLQVRFSAPAFLQTNVQSFSLHFGGQVMHFFPDRVLVYEESNARAISYRQLRVVASTVQVPEDNTPPDDAKVVGRTWRHVDANGQRDANHPVNRELPLCEYGQLEFTGPGSLHETVQCSRIGAAHEFAHVLATLASLVPDSA